MQQVPEAMTLKVIALIHTAFYQVRHPAPERAGRRAAGEIVSPGIPQPRRPARLEDFGHIWLVWQFSGAVRESWSPPCAPPRLGGNTRVGVFATRSPFRPNPLGLSA